MFILSYLYIFLRMCLDLFHDTDVIYEICSYAKIKAGSFWSSFLRMTPLVVQVLDG